MGQQQLLLIALSVIIVGAAVAVGVNIMNEGQNEVQSDQLYQRANYIATKFAEAWNVPENMGGLGRDIDNITDGTDVDAICAILGIDPGTEGQSDVWITTSVILDAAIVDDPATAVDESGLPTGTLILNMETESYECTAPITSTGNVDWSTGLRPVAK